MMRYVELPKNTSDETGNRYGRLKVISYAGTDKADTGGNSKKPRGAHAMWECKCECGNTVTVRGSRLRSGRQVSCGCQRADPVLKQNTRLKMPATERKRIAAMGAKAAKS